MKFDAPDKLWAATYIVKELPHRDNRFLIMLQSLQIRTWSGLYLGLRPASWAVPAIGPLGQVDICGITTSPWTCHQPSYFDSRSGYGTISIHRSDTSIITKPHASSYLDLLHAIAHLQSSNHLSDATLGWWYVRYTLMSPQDMSAAARPSHLLCTFLWKVVQFSWSFG
jgi:hypothetical protein